MFPLLVRICLFPGTLTSYFRYQLAQISHIAAGLHTFIKTTSLGSQVIVSRALFIIRKSASDFITNTSVTHGNFSTLSASVLRLTKYHFGGSLLHQKAKCTLEVMAVLIDGLPAQRIFVIFVPMSHLQALLSSWK